jgi:hypothetical protein
MVGVEGLQGLAVEGKRIELQTERLVSQASCLPGALGERPANGSAAHGPSE